MTRSTHNVASAPALLFALLVLAISQLGAQPAPRIESPGTIPVEVIGLKLWTIPMIQDSLKKYAPSVSLQSSACARVLRYTLHFADAAVSERSVGDGPHLMVVSVREPQDSSRVRHRMLPSDTLGRRAEWRVATDVLQSRPDIFYTAAQTFLGRISGWHREQRFRTAGDSAAARDLVAFFAGRNGEADRRLAQRSLASDSSMPDRMVAALILANFSSRDDTWYALIEALRENDGWVIGTAGNVLNALATAPRRVDWRPKSDAIRVMLDGTGLFGLPSLMRTLNATGIGPAYARPFLRKGGEMLTAYLGSSDSELSESSHFLLIKLRGADLGREVAPWRQWIASL